MALRVPLSRQLPLSGLLTLLSSPPLSRPHNYFSRSAPMLTSVARGYVDLSAAGVGERPEQWQIVRLHGEHVVPGRDRREVKAPIGVAAHRETAVKDYPDVRGAGFIERPEVALPGGGTIRYRFEVQVPKDAPAGECRFGILIEGEEPAVAQTGALRLPMSLRYATFYPVRTIRGCGWARQAVISAR